jgi:dihydrofolate reductase
MRKVILMMNVSLDGFMEGPNQELDWHLVDDELHRHFNEWLGGVGAFLDGRVTYELMARFWPTADQEPDATETVREFAAIWREMPKIVFSTTLESAGWNTTIEREVVPEQIMKLKRQADGDLVIGGADLAASFLRHDLIDEFRIYVQPILLGRGKPLFSPAHIRLPLRLAETRTFGSGVVMLRYERATA